ncbi:MAG: aldo/keto reductase [Clostridiales bacterium]|nr:aldo/keto reductase [Clostridiales bacterium]MDY2835091.1 aldo/keto reductase [Candidatus Aphodomonas sp.]
MMNTLTLNNGIQMPVLGFGTFMMNGSECEESVLTAIRAGYRMIDTAEAYGNEEAVGNAIIKSGVSRKELFLVTKVNFRSYENTRETVEASLKKLKTDYLDLVLLHWPFGNYYTAWRELEKLYQNGTIRAIGVSNFNPDRLIDLIEFNQVPPAVDQIETHLLCQRRAEHA